MELKYITNTSIDKIIYVCANNLFPYGRWTTNTNNTKLYPLLDISCNIAGVSMTNKRKSTGNIYGNVSNTLYAHHIELKLIYLNWCYIHGFIF